MARINIKVEFISVRIYKSLHNNLQWFYTLGRKKQKANVAHRFCWCKNMEDQMNTKSTDQEC